MSGSGAKAARKAAGWVNKPIHNHLRQWWTLYRKRAWKNRIIPQTNTWNILRGDRVQIIAGKDKGRTGRVTKVFRKQNRIIMPGRNMVTAFRRAKAGENRPGRLTRVEAPVHVSNVMLLDPSNNVRTRVKRIKGPDGKTVRISRRTGQPVPRAGFLASRRRREEPGDSLPDDVTAVTFDGLEAEYERFLAAKIAFRQQKIAYFHGRDDMEGGALGNGDGGSPAIRTSAAPASASAGPAAAAPASQADGSQQGAPAPGTTDNSGLLSRIFGQDK